MISIYNVFIINKKNKNLKKFFFTHYKKMNSEVFVFS
jgi:hypothetical protein